MSMTPEGPNPSSVQTTIVQLSYWVPSIKDVAHVEENGHDDGWTLSISPLIAAACPVAITIRETGRFDLWIAGETYADRALGRLDQIVTLLERISEGEVVQRRWISVQTGLHQGTETIVSLAPNEVWRSGEEALALSKDGAERHDRHFLPYRR